MQFKNLHTVTNFYTGPLNTTGQQWVANPTLTFTQGDGWTFQV